MEPRSPPLPSSNPSPYLSFFVAAAPPSPSEVRRRYTSIVSVASMMSSATVRHFQPPLCRSAPRSEDKTTSTLLRAPVTGFVTLSTLCDVSSALTTASKFGSGGSSCDRFTLAFAGSRHASSILSPSHQWCRSRRCSRRCSWRCFRRRHQHHHSLVLSACDPPLLLLLNFFCC
ncbi:hypothetical protein PIB30_029202 [Stylosanthes scabra]|uniref:Uncharacterized protein n=1 Tax=Stylosanthes scabra TaxID=79078 RepID=A0ABU6QAN2_9FABA|nr:hypothetical protein [Stylosanthes scabra]